MAEQSVEVLRRSRHYSATSANRTVSLALEVITQVILEHSFDMRQQRDTLIVAVALFARDITRVAN